ncbi:MAG TPA: pentose kinase, partial [Clostridiales bacterium]|nr:pentose kinase [Clostridiales bacterium]
MKSYLIAYDFGTGGIKASLYDREGKSHASSFEAYDTYYPHVGWYEQRPGDWWGSICTSTKRLIAGSGVSSSDIEALAISGHSLGVVPLDANGALLRDSVPIWSDTRAQPQAAAFFQTHDYARWYMQTGNGFPAHLYAAFKVMWYRQNEPETYRKIDTILGTKDYINYRLTGVKMTDHSYASGSGFYDLRRAEYDGALLAAMELPRELFPDIVASTHILGTLTPEAAEQTGLPAGVKVACGGVDNSCMALGARGIYDGRVYTSLGSSSWIAVTSHEPLLDTGLSPFVFAHVIPGMYASATSIFSAGSSLQWVRNEICKDIVREYENPYDRINELAAGVPLGANKLLFNPSLAGGTGADKTPNIRGAFIGLDLKHTQADLIRAAMEGIALSLRTSLDNLKKMCALTNEMLFVGGGANSGLWLQIFADIYGMDILKTNVGQEAGSLGAAA